jgi:Tfp pilus assembly protein PilP
MKKAILLIMVVVLAGCQDESETQYSVNPDLSPYVEQFYASAAQNGVIIPKNLVADFGITQAITQERTQGAQNTFLYDRALFEYQKTNGLESEIEKNVFVGLGRLLLKKNVVWENKDQYIIDLF